MTNVARDVLWERAVASLPPPLLVALRAAGLDDPSVLVEYLRNTQEELESGLGRTLVGLDALAPSGATSSGQRTITYGHGVPGQVPEWPGVASGSGGVGGDPRTDHFVPSGGEVKTDHFVPTGGDPKTDHFVPSGGEVKTDHFVPSGGDPKTDLFPFSAQLAGVVDVMAATCPPYRPGAVAPQTATSDTVSPALDPDLAVSRGFGHVRPDGFPSLQLASDPVHPDGFPSSQLASDHVHFDGFPSSAELPEDLDGFPSSDHLDSTLGVKSTGFTPILHIAENSERLRESDFGVQIVPASRSPSELSAHQMGLSLAGTSRDPISTLAIGESVQLSISDRALLRKYKSSEQVQEISRQGETYKEITAGVPRVDGHPPEPSLSLYDRMLLRKYSVPGMETTPSHSSTLSSSPPVSLPAESMKKRRRFYQKGKLSKDVTKEDPRNENSQDQEGSPCGFSSKVAEPPVRAGTIIFSFCSEF